MIMKHRINSCGGRPLSDLASDFENIIESVFGDGTSSESEWAPRANVSETDTGYSVELELPGIASDDVSVELQDGILEVSGTKKVATEIEGSKLLKSERRHGSFRRTFKFQTQLDADKISAEFKHGILTVQLPKSERVLPRKIEVKIAE